MPNARSDRAKLDALQEVGEIGAGHAVSALAGLLGATVLIHPASAAIVKLSSIAKDESFSPRTVASSVSVLGDITGKFFLITSATHARVLATKLIQERENPPDSAYEDSALKELGNISASAFLTALSDFLGLMTMPSVPELLNGAPEEVLKAQTVDSDETDPVMAVIRVPFFCELGGDPVEGQFLFFPGKAALRSILSVMEVG